MDITQMVRVARMYYEFGYKQEEIAAKEGVSRASISRILDKAYKEGIVQIKVVYPLQPVRDLEESLIKQFNLKKAFVVPVFIDHPEAVRNDLGMAVADFLNEIVSDREILGVSWGTTLPFVTQHLKKCSKQQINIVQLNGGVAKSYLATQSGAIVED
nr:sugar-binding transcriptional regulator [Clostridia bacterium]